MKTILVTGATGFIGKNLIKELTVQKKYKVIDYTRETTDTELREQLRTASFIVHLAGVSRPNDPEEFYRGNSDFTKKITTILLEENLSVPIFYTSSIHAAMDNDFGKSKRLAEEYLIKYHNQANSPLYIIRLTNTFGPYAKPNTHSVVATFCYNIAHNLDISITDPNKEITLAYVDDVISSIVEIIDEKEIHNLKETEPHIFTFTKTHTLTLSKLADTIKSFKNENTATNSFDIFKKELYATYLSYI